MLKVDVRASGLYQGLGFVLLRPWWRLVPTARFERATPALGAVELPKIA
jgi:hypothetical protein